jgi:UPF0176 protein
MIKNHFTVVSFYEFKNIKTKYLKFKDEINKTCIDYSIRGTVILSKEGINGTLSGLDNSINSFLLLLKTLEFNNLDVKYSYSKTIPFYKLKIKIKSEIVPFGNKVKNPVDTGKFIEPEEWNKFVEDPSVLVLDVRNAYETRIGKFKNSTDPKTTNFTEFEQYIESKLLNKKDQPIAMYCTGGIRCEKASAYMIQKGFKNIFQLKGGILKYLEDTNPENSLWENECFVFDNRVSVKQDLSPGTYELCKGCKNPISKIEKASFKYEIGVSCLNCFDERTDNQKKNSRERQKQIDLHQLKGKAYPFDKLDTYQYKKIYKNKK